MAYSTTYFKGNPEKAKLPGILYIVVLVNRKTYERECIKIGITQGKTWKDAIVRSKGFTNYDIRIQKIIDGTIEEVYNLEQALHQEFAEFRFNPSINFGGKTECFSMSCLKEVLEFIK